MNVEEKHENEMYFEEFRQEIERVTREFENLRKEMREFSGQIRQKTSQQNLSFQNLSSFASLANGLMGGGRGGSSRKKSDSWFDLSARESNYISNFSKNLTNKILGFRQNGGMVGGGGAYVVGEKGPEIFKPTISGEILPNGVGMNSGINLTMNVTCSDANSFAKNKNQILAELGRALRASKLS